MPEMDGFEATRLIRSFERSFAHKSISKEKGRRFDFGAEEDGKGDGDGDREEIDEAEKAVEMAKMHPPKGRSWGTRAYIVALTGLASRRDRDEAQSSGLDDFLTKPVSFAKVGDLLGRLSEEKGKAQE